MFHNLMITFVVHLSFADQDAVDYLTPLRLCMLVDAGSVKKVRTAVKALFP
jgi:hypothetical protein